MKKIIKALLLLKLVSSAVAFADDQTPVPVPPPPPPPPGCYDLSGDNCGLY